PRRRHPHHRRPHLFSGHRPRSGRRALGHECRNPLCGCRAMTMMSQAAAPLFQRRNEPMSLLDGAILVPAIGAAVRKLDPRTLAGNPVMFVVEIVALLTTVFFLRDLVTGGSAVVGMHAGFSGQIAAWLWFTVLFAN